MNSEVTDNNKAYTYAMPRAELRQMLIDAQQRTAPYHYDFHESRAGFWECVGLTVGAFLMLGGLGLAIAWGLYGIQ